MDWFHDLPTLPLALIVLVVVNGGAALGLRLLAAPLRRLNGKGHLDNSTIAGLLSALVGIYSVAAGLTAVAVWANSGEANRRVGHEATAIVLLDHDLGEYPPALQVAARAQLARYVRHVIDEEWPAHLSGTTIGGGPGVLSELRHLLYAYEPSTEAQRIGHAEALRNYNRLIEARRERVRAAEDTKLPGPLWIVVTLLGALAIVSCFLLQVDNFRLHLLVTTMVATPIALIVFFIAVTDRPFRGGVTVSPEPYVEVAALFAQRLAPPLAPRQP